MDTVPRLALRKYFVRYPCIIDCNSNQQLMNIEVIIRDGNVPSYIKLRGVPIFLLAVYIQNI